MPTDEKNPAFSPDQGKPAQQTPVYKPHDPATDETWVEKGMTPPGRDGRLASGGPDVERRTEKEKPADVLGSTMKELGKARVDGKVGGR